MPMASPLAEIVVPVTRLEDFSACLRLRFDVYRQLGYINHSAGFDLDPFDWSSYHFMSIDATGTISGTVRLIVQGDSQIQSRPELSAAHQWSSQMNDQTRLGLEWSHTLPILDTVIQNGLNLSLLESTSPAELSRIIVSEHSRGRGVATRLIAAVVQQAEQLGIDALFLQCRPMHVRLFQRSGFKPILDSLAYDQLTVPDPITAMRRPLLSSVGSSSKSPDTAVG
jgi:N-acyl-L-homoserine lactone synthetase